MLMTTLDPATATAAQHNEPQLVGIKAGLSDETRAALTKQMESGDPLLVGMQTGLELVFPDENTRPSIRAFNSWKKDGFFSSLKINKRVFINPVQVRKELEARFTINAGRSL
jgi:hypothetical protein